jgi:hypothetical protein
MKFGIFAMLSTWVLTHWRHLICCLLLGACLFKSSRKFWYLIQEMLKLEILISSFKFFIFFCSVEKQRKYSGFYHSVIVKWFFWGANFDTKNMIWTYMQRIFHEKESKFTETWQISFWIARNFHCRFHVARNIEKALKFFYFHIWFIVKFGKIFCWMINNLVVSL